jgi:hypothetical protein
VITAPLGSIFTLSAGEKLMTHDGTPEELAKKEKEEQSNKVAPSATEENIANDINLDINEKNVELTPVGGSAEKMINPESDIIDIIPEEGKPDNVEKLNPDVTAEVNKGI